MGGQGKFAKPRQPRGRNPRAYAAEEWGEEDAYGEEWDEEQGEEEEPDEFGDAADPYDDQSWQNQPDDYGYDPEPEYEEEVDGCEFIQVPEEGTLASDGHWWSSSQVALKIHDEANAADDDEYSSALIS